jgi:hypothetical protein
VGFAVDAGDDAPLKGIMNRIRMIYTVAQIRIAPSLRLTEF